MAGSRRHPTTQWIAEESSFQRGDRDALDSLQSRPAAAQRNPTGLAVRASERDA